MRLFSQVFRRALKETLVREPTISRWAFLSEYKIDVILDVGAHLGEFSRELLEVFPSAHVACFEPIPESADYLRKTTMFEVVESAISDRNGTAVFHQSSFVQSSSLLEMMDSHKTLWPHSSDHRSFPVTISRLDDWWNSRVPVLEGQILIKIDSQGAEREIIAGGEAVLTKAAVVVCEICFFELYKGQALAPELIEKLSSIGLQLIGVMDIHSDANGRQVFANAVFAKTVRVSDV